MFVGFGLLRFGSSDRAGLSAGSAIDAKIRVDDVLAVAFADAADRTDVCTGAAHHTVVIDNMCHYKAPPFLR